LVLVRGAGRVGFFYLLNKFIIGKGFNRFIFMVYQIIH